MKSIGTHNYLVYITINKNRTVLYSGVTNNLPYRLEQHEEEAKTTIKSFAGNPEIRFVTKFKKLLCRECSILHMFFSSLVTVSMTERLQSIILLYIVIN